MQCIKEIKEIKEWLSNRPSACLDPFDVEKLRKKYRLQKLKKRRLLVRLYSKMMKAQNESVD